MLVTDGVFGITDDVLGGFTDDVTAAFPVIAQRLRSKAQVERDFQATLNTYEEGNRQTVSAAEDILFTTFTRELADKVKLSPRYIDRKAQELNDKLWEISKWFFERYNEKNTDFHFVIDEAKRTITATNYEHLPVLFYYWTESRNKPYRSQKVYSMGKDFRPKAGQITLSRTIGRGILHELDCADTGRPTVSGMEEPCEISFYTVTLTSSSSRTEQPVLCERTESGKGLDEEACKELLDLPVLDYTEEGHRSPHWLKSGSQPRTQHLGQPGTGSPSGVGDRHRRPAPAADLTEKGHQTAPIVYEAAGGAVFEAMRLDMGLEEKLRSFTEKEK